MFCFMAEYRNPTPTVDIILRNPRGIVLIKRKNEPHGRALPGGFVDEGEAVETAALREAEEETGLKARLVDFLYVYSDPQRDPRKHTLSSVFIAEFEGEPAGADDALDAKVYSREEIKNMKLAFDHDEILNDYFTFIDTGRKPSPADKLQRYT